MKSLVYLKNKFTPSNRALVSVFDRSFLFGDSIFEVLVTAGGKIFDFEGHWQRLQNSSKLTGIEIPFNKNQFQKILEQGLQKLKTSRDVRIRAMISRGEMQSPGLSSKNSQPYPVIIFSEFEKITQPLKLMVSRVPHMSMAEYNPAKSGNYLNNILALQEAQKKGFHDALFCNTRGEVCEGTTSNVFVVKAGKVYTPPLTQGILKGRTREMIFKLCQQYFIPIKEQAFKKDFLLKADEIFLSNTPQGVMRVGQVDGKKMVKDAKLTEFLKKALEYHMQLSSL
jgi:branched-chain amino acid aminotransferase